MPINDSDITHIAKLARLHIASSQLPDYEQDLNRILNLVDDMQKVDTEGIMPLSNPHDATQRLRQDKVTQNDNTEAFLALAPETEQGLYLVPKVIE